MSTGNIEAKMPSDVLEVRAAEQRRRIHETVLELREQVEEKLDVRRQAAEYVWPGVGVAALAGLMVGWGLTGIFSTPRR
jgi:hypothetical protein